MHKEIEINHQALVLGKPAIIQIPLHIHNVENSGIIILNYPGYNGDINGYNDKYLKVAELLQERKIGTVIRTENKVIDGAHYPTSVQEVLHSILQYCLDNSKELCGSQNPIIYICAFSAGASAVASVLGAYPEIKKVLLVGPSVDTSWEAMENGLFNYAGELYVAVGNLDEVVGSGVGSKCSKLALNARVNKLEIIPNCDHQFRGKENGKILSKAPLWAFAGDETFPSPEGGLELYL